MSAFPELDIRVASECLAIAPLWDTYMVPFNPTTGEIVCRGEWRMAEPTVEPDSAGGMRAKQALHTAILLQCFTDKYSTNPNLRGTSDPRGWWGDGIDQEGAPEMGNEAWTLFNGILNNQIVAQAQAYFQQALQPLLTTRGGPVAKFTVVASMDITVGAMYVDIRGYSQDGLMVYDTKWQYAWTQTTKGPFPASPSFVVQ